MFKREVASELHSPAKPYLIPDENHDHTGGIFKSDSSNANNRYEISKEPIKLSHIHTSIVAWSNHENDFSEQFDRFKELLDQDCSSQEDQYYYGIYADTDKPVQREHFNEYKARRDERNRCLMDIMLDTAAKYREAMHSQEIWREKCWEVENKLQNRVAPETRDDENFQITRRGEKNEIEENPLATISEEINEPYFNADLFENENYSATTHPKDFLYPKNYLSKFTEVQVDIKIMRLRALEVLKDWLSMQSLAKEVIENEMTQLNYQPLTSRGYYYLGVAQYAQKHFNEAIESFSQAQPAIGHYEEGYLAIKWLSKAQKAFDHPSSANTPVSVRSGDHPPVWTPISPREFWEP